VVPTFTTNRSTSEMPSYTPAASPTPQTFSVTSDQHKAGSELAPLFQRDHALQTAHIHQI